MNPASSQSMAVNRLDSAEPDFGKKFAALLAWEAETDEAVENAVAEILRAVRSEGDAAVLRY
ncbi:MAG: histidinol dehydrogenase, partial [Betaproteobacteria bacterium]|nr:histidinol dehydrogenase [Betaproteobacteria bacterium]